MADNPNAFKHAYSPDTVRTWAEVVASRVHTFDAEAFLAAALPGLEALEMKARVDRLAEAVHAATPLPFPAAVEALLPALGPAGSATDGDRWGPPDGSDGLTGFQVWPLTRFVALWGLPHREASLAALAEMTRRFTAEFALRPFLLDAPDETLAVLRSWSRSPDQHLRRAASEGTRPRLPWGLRLHPFVRDPSPVLELVAPLRDDPSSYVRRSVANNLNDIGKDHPQRLVEVAADWWSGSARTKQLVKHALRGLVKAGDPGALRILGFAVPARVQVESFAIEREHVVLGEPVDVVARLRSTADTPQKLVVDYLLEMPGAGRRPRQKLWKGSTPTLGPGETIEVRYTLRLKPVTTRAHRDGEHALELMVCGESLGRVGFVVEAP